MQGLSKYPSRAPFARCRLSLALGCALALSGGLVHAADGVTELESMEITGKLSSPVSDDKGYVAKKSRSATKINTPLHETPRSVTVVTQQQMEDRNVQTISDALRYSAGIQAGYFGEDNKQDWFIVRGFKQANNGLFQDGVRVYSSGFYSWQVDPYALERVEVLKGASSVLYGQATPGGVINLQSKRPTADARNEVGIEYGSFDRKALHLDVGGKLDEQGDVLYRVVALSRDTGTQVDHVGAERLMFAPSMTFNFNDATSLTLLANFQKDNSDPQLQFLPAEGTLFNGGNGYIDTDTAVGNPDYEKFDRTQFTLGYELNHRLNDSWDFQQNFRYGHLDVDLRQMYYAGHGIDLLRSAASQAVGGATSGPAFDFAFGMVSAAYPDLNDPSRRRVVRGLTYTDGQAENLSFDNRLVNYWIGSGFESTFLVGVDYQLLNIDEKSFTGSVLVREPLDIYNPSYADSVNLVRVTPAGLVPVTSADLHDKRTRADQLGVYMHEQLKIGDNWVFMLGGRYDNARSDIDNQTTDSHVSLRDEEFTWSTGVAYVADNGLTPYASYSEFFRPVAELNATTGKPFSPETGEQKEIGIKYQPLGFPASFNAALFELTQQNVKKTLAGNVQTQLGEVRVRGLELEATADITENLSLVGAYTKLDPETTKGLAAEKGKTPANVADEMASLWARYRFNGGALDGFGFGAGARYVGHTYGDNTETQKVPSFTVYDAMLSYDWQNLRLQLNANNVTDKEYVATCEGNCFYGNRRNVIASVSYAW